MLSKRAKRAVEVMRHENGYFVHKLETGYMGREQFRARLRRKIVENGKVVRDEAVKGFGFSTLHELEEAGMLYKDFGPPSSTYPTYYLLREEYK